MGKFKTFLNEQETEGVVTLTDIKALLAELTEDEIDELGAYLFTEFFDSEEDSIEDFYFSTADVISMIEDLGEEMYEDIYDMLSIPEHGEEDEDVVDFDTHHAADEIDNDDQTNEGVSRVVQTKNINRKKRKFMKKSLTQLRKEAPARRIEMRKTFAKRKRYMRANATKLAAYKKMRGNLIKSGKHHVKLRKKSGGTV